jgi:formate dehydrogenase major subunit
MTNHWIDVKNARTIMVLGANPVENHPVVAQYINTARDAGARVIVADPRRTRTAAQADKHLRMRPGTNGALIMGLINYLISNNLYDSAYQTRTVSRTFTDASGNTVTKATWPKYTDATFKLNTARMDYDRDGSGFPVITTLADSSSVFSVLAARAAHYTTSVVESVCDLVPGSFEPFAAMVADSRGDTAAGYEDGTGPLKGAKFPGTILYAMGGTQFSHASQDLRAYSMMQMLLGNMGKAGGGVNALRGIHNVQGSTDMGVLYSSMPGYSDVPPRATDPSPSGYRYDDYMDKLYGGVRKVGTGGFYWNISDATNGWNLQQHGFRNTIWHWFGQGADPLSADVLTAAPETITNPNFDLLPKGNGLDHRAMFQKAAATYLGADRVKCMFVLGQNPAVTEPNLTLVKQGLYDLDTLVVTDMFESETAGCSRKGGGVTFLLPSGSFVEEEGSVTNSGRWIQWRYKAINPQGNSKSDTEILLTLADKLFAANAFTHIPGATYAGLYGTYGWTPGSDFNAVAATVAENVFTVIAHKNQASTPYGALWIYRGGVNGWNQTFGTAGTISAAAAGATTLTAATLTGVYNGSVLWVGDGATKEQVCVASHTGNTTLNLTKGLKYAHSSGANLNIAHVLNRAKARGTVDVGDQASDTLSGKSIYGNWGWAWLKNRRVFYNNGGVNQDVADTFVAPDQVGRYYVHGFVDTGKPTPVMYSTTYRAYSTLKDLNNGDGTSGAASGDPARMPKHWEPHETPNTAAMTKYGKTGDNATGTVGAVASFPLVLTTIRVTEHFQGGPTTRNVPWLCELQPEPFIEINSADAFRYGIKNGDPVYIDTARASDAGPFTARVGTGTGASQLVKKGTVAIPWHWGNKGISTGESANTVTIDALDVNIKMPEYKACLCRIYTT